MRHINRFHFFLIASIGLHLFLIWNFRSLRLANQSALIAISFTAPPVIAPHPPASSVPRKSRSPAEKATGTLTPPTQSANKAQSSSNEKDAMAGLGNVATDIGGVATGGSAGLPETLSNPAAGTGMKTGASGTFSDRLQPSPGSRKTSDNPYVIVIPESIRPSISSFEDTVYADVDKYVLHGPDLRVATAVPGNELCIDGNLVRTKERILMTQTITDASKCEMRDYGGEVERSVCPPDAHTRGVVFDGYLASSINYQVNMCISYDRSHCYAAEVGDGAEREICRQTFKYEGIWAAGTKFDYRCTNSLPQNFSHPLEYKVRFIQDVANTSGRLRPRILRTETRAVSKCQ